jgi:hypothetical protein
MPVSTGALEPLEQARHLLLDLAQVADVGEGAVAELGGLRHEVAVGRRADADREEARVAEPLLDDREQLRLVADAAVGQEHDLAHEPRVVAADERRLERARHLGPACAASRSTQRRARRDSRAWPAGVLPERLRDAVELDHVEAVVGAQPVDRERQRLAGLLDGSPSIEPEVSIT